MIPGPVLLITLAEASPIHEDMQLERGPRARGHQAVRLGRESNAQPELIDQAARLVLVPWLADSR